MSVKIRLARTGKKKAPFYRVVATDTRSPRDGRFIEILGRYNPRTDPSTIEIDVDRVDAWLGNGAQMSETVAKLYAIAKDPEAAQAPTGKTAESAKDKARAEAEEKAKEEAKEAAAKPEEPVEDDEAPEAADESAEAEEAPAEEEAPSEDAVEEAPAEEAASEEEEEAPAEAEASEDASDEADKE